MFELVGRPRRDLLSPARRFRYRCRIRLAHLKRAWGYVAGKLSTDDAQRMILDCRGPAGWHPLLVLKVDDTLQQARDEFADHPELRRLIADACFHVGDRWESSGDELWEARRWAINVALRYAAAEGITLVRLADDAEPDDWRAPADAR
jgi:hypothetical protein